MSAVAVIQVWAASSLRVRRPGVGAMTWGEAPGLARLHPANIAYGGRPRIDEEKAALEASLGADGGLEGSVRERLQQMKNPGDAWGLHW